MRVLVCGGRDYDDHRHVFAVLNGLRPTLIVQGGAEGADASARRWAGYNGCPYQTFIPQWAQHGKMAGPIRNEQMLRGGKPEMVVALPGGRGTADMVKRARRAGLPVLRVNHHGHTEFVHD